MTTDPNAAAATRGAHAQVEHNLTNHPPVNQTVVEHMEELRDYMLNAGHAIVTFCPPGRETALALTKLEETTMWAIAAIARNQPEAAETPGPWDGDEGPDLPVRGHQ